MAVAKLAALITITGPITLGRMWRKMMRPGVYPSALAASTNSISRTRTTSPRTTRATSTHMVRPTAMNTCTKPLPKARVMAMTSSSVGMLQTTFTSHMITSSTGQRLTLPNRRKVGASALK